MPHSRSAETGRATPPRRGLALVAELGFALGLIAARAVILAADALDLYRLDELYAGAAGLEIAAGRGLPWALVAHAPYSGGSILVALAASYLFPLLGGSALVLRLPSLAVHLAALVAWRAVARRLAGARAAAYLGWLYVLAPPEFARLGVLAWGNHTESILPTALALLALASLLARGGTLVAEPAGRRQAIRAFAGAALAMVALYFSYAALVPLLGLALVVLALAPGILRDGRGPAILAGALVGFAPAAALAMARQVDGPGFLVRLLGMRLDIAVAKARSLLFVDLRHYLAPDLGLPALLESLFWAASGLAAILALFRAGRGLSPGREVPAEAVLVLPPLLFVPVYAFSGFPVGPGDGGILAYRYLTPITPFLLAVLAAALSRLGRRRGALLLALILLPNLAALVHRLPQADSLVTRLSGAHYLGYGGHVFEVFGFAREETMAVLARVGDDDDRRAAEMSVATVSLGLIWRPPQGPPRPQRLPRLLAAMPGPAERQALWVDRLALLLDGEDGLALTRGDWPELVALLAAHPAPIAGPLARSAVIALAGDEGAARVAVAALPEAYREWGVEGLGVRAGQRSGDLRRAAPAGVEPSAAWWRGVGFALAEAALVRGRFADPAPPGDREAQHALARGIDRALRAADPEDPVRRRALAARAGLDRSWHPEVNTGRVVARP